MLLDLICDNLFVSCDVISKGLTPLHFACQNAHFEIARLLLNHGADIEAVTKNVSHLLLAGMIHVYCGLMFIILCFGISGDSLLLTWHHPQIAYS